MKSEVNPLSRSFCLVETDVPEDKFIKRRRRSPVAITLTSDASQGGHGLQQQQTLQVDQNNGATTTTVKRSSRFRGVSRYDYISLARARLILTVIHKIPVQNALSQVIKIMCHNYKNIF